MIKSVVFICCEQVYVQSVVLAAVTMYMMFLAVINQILYILVTWWRKVLYGACGRVT